MTSLLLALLAATDPAPPAAEGQQRPPVVVATNALNWVIAYPGVEVDVPLQPMTSLYFSGNVFLPQMVWGFVRPGIPGIGGELGIRAYPHGDAPWGTFVEGRVKATLAAAGGPFAPSAETYFGLGGAVGYRWHLARLVVAVGAGLDFEIIPNSIHGPLVPVPVLRLWLGTWR